MYLADDASSSIRSINTTLNFSEIIDIDNAKEGMQLEDNIIIKDIECRVLNGRKISVKINLSADLKLLSNEKIEYITGIKDIKDIQIKEKNAMIDTLLGRGTTKAYAKDTITIEDTDDLKEILKADVTIKNTETKASYNKILIKADTIIKIMYLTEDNRICFKETSIPIMGFVDVQDVNDQNICNVKYEISNLLIKPNNIEEHSLYVEVEVEIECDATERRELNIIEDLYSPSIELEYEEKNVETTAQREVIKEKFTIKEKQELVDIGNRKIYDVEIKPNILNRSISKGKVIYEGQLEINVLYESENALKIASKNILIPFEYNIDSDKIKPTSRLETMIEIRKQDFIVMPDNIIDMRIDLEFVINLLNNEKLQLLEEITIKETRKIERPSLVIYFVKKGDTLWNIAKKFKSTVKDIVDINGIEDENKIDVGEQLFIPNYIG